MFDVISIGALGMDLFFKGDTLTTEDNRFQLAEGGKYFCNTFTESLGGGGANVAIGISKTGLKTAVLAKIGENSFKDIIISKLKDAGVDYSLCTFDPDYTNISSILLSKKGERAIINYRTPHQQIVEEKEDYKKLLATRCVYMGNMPEASFTTKCSLIHFLKRSAIMVCMNIGVHDARLEAEKLKTLLEHVDILIVNGYEFADIVKKEHSILHFKKDVVTELLPYMKSKVVVVTEGEKGSYAYLNGAVFYQEALKPAEIVDTTGAGDGYTAGFLADYLTRRDISHAMKMGAKTARDILGKMGAN